MVAKTKSSPKTSTRKPQGAAKKTRAAAAPPVNAAAYVVKSEPYVYSFDQLLADKKTSWDGVRNYEARNTLRAMKKGDTLLYYHSNEGKEIVGIARVSKEAYQDPTTEDDWSSVEVVPVKRLKRPVSLAQLKAHPVLSKMSLVTRGRISVTPVTRAQLDAVLALGDTKL
jgi:predicted RNA-binding protein with PUA-like domain